jgi:putative spermidine/putrescine transport system permease protein
VSTKAGTVAAQLAPPPPYRIRLSRPVSGLAFVLPLALLVLVAFDVPIALMLGWAFQGKTGPFANFAELVQKSVYLRVLWNTFRIAAITTVACAVLGYVLAYWLRTLQGRARMVALALVILPFWVSILVRTYAWIVVLGNNGIVNRSLVGLGVTDEPVAFLYNQLGVVIGTTNVLLPFLVLPLFAAMVKIDDRLLQAAASLGAPGWTVFRRVFFPLTIPALGAGCILVFILTLGFFITPAILGGGRVPMIANMMDLLINRLPRWELAAAISTVLLVTTLGLYALYRLVGSRGPA